MRAPSLSFCSEVDDGEERKDGVWVRVCVFADSREREEEEKKRTPAGELENCEMMAKELYDDLYHIIHLELQGIDVRVNRT